MQLYCCCRYQLIKLLGTQKLPALGPNEVTIHGQSIQQYLVSFVNLTQTQVIQEAGTSIKRMPPSV